MIKRLAIIPARGGSKRIKNKNLNIFHGKPLIYYPISAAKNSKIFDKIHVSSDSKKILDYSNELKIKTDFVRPKYLANDKIGLRDVVKYVISRYQKINHNYDEIWLIYATNPFITKNIIRNCLKSFKKIPKNKKNALITITKYNYPIDWAQRLTIQNTLTPLNKKKIKIDSKKAPKVFCDAGMINIYRKENFDTISKTNYFPFEIPFYSSVDIDNLEDFEFAKRLFKKNKNVI